MTERADQLHHDNAPAHSIFLVQAFFRQNITSPMSVNPLQPRSGSLRLLVFRKAKIPIEMEGICECDGHTVHRLSQRRLTADWLDPQESNCSRMHSKISSDWLPSYIKTTRPVLEIFKMAETLSGEPSYLGPRRKLVISDTPTPPLVTLLPEKRHDVLCPRCWVDQSYGPIGFKKSRPPSLGHQFTIYDTNNILATLKSKARKTCGELSHTPCISKIGSTGLEAGWKHL